MKNIKNIVIVILSLIVIVLIFFVVKLRLDLNVEQENNLNDNLIKNEEEEREYDCTFTRTFRMIEKVDYPLAADGVSYIVVDTFQGYTPFVVAIPSTIDDLEVYKYYEFTYYLKGKGAVNDFKDLHYYLVSSLFNKYHGNTSSGTVYVGLDIAPATKNGVEQIQENICK